MLEHFKDTPINIFKTLFFSILIKKCTLPKKIANITGIIICLTYCGSTKCPQPVWSHESCKQCYFFHLCCTFIQGQLVKRRKNNIIPYREFFLTQCLFLGMIDMYRSLALFCIRKYCLQGFNCELLCRF